MRFSNHRPEIMYKAFEIGGYNKEEVDAKFSGMISAFRYGAPPHGGIAPGLDRIVMLLAEVENLEGDCGLSDESACPGADDELPPGSSPTSSSRSCISLSNSPTKSSDSLSVPFYLTPADPGIEFYVGFGGARSDLRQQNLLDLEESHLRRHAHGYLDGQLFARLDGHLLD